MAPTAEDATDPLSKRFVQDARLWQRQPQGSTAVSTTQASAGSGSDGNTTNVAAYVGTGVAVGGILLALTIVLLFKLFRRRREHRRAMEVLEAQSTDHDHNMRQIPRPITLPRIGHVPALNIQAGWDALSSSDTVDRQATKQSKRRSVGLPKRLKKSSNVRLQSIKHLSAIVESPTSRLSKPSSPDRIAAVRSPLSDTQTVQTAPRMSDSFRLDSDDVFVSQAAESKQSIVLKASETSGEIEAATHEYFKKRAPRAASMDLVPSTTQGTTDSRNRLSRPLIHTRSFSLGAPPSSPPSGPVPPLPASRPGTSHSSHASRSAIQCPRLSNDSPRSVNSLILLGGLATNVGAEQIPDSIWTKRQMAGAADMKPETGKNRSLRASPNTDRSDKLALKDAVHERNTPVEKFGTHPTGSKTVRTLSDASSLSGDEREKRLSIPKFGTAERVSIRSVSSVNSIKSTGSSRKVTSSPRRRPSVNTTVSPNGSPVQRKRSVGLREVSPNTLTPSRQNSVATEDSSHSSNGNPFQWDSNNICKPSALKGSPNSRKGHKRQNCVRISTLTPQVLGPPPSRSNSPSITHGIEEESSDEKPQTSPLHMRFVSNQRLKRPSSSGSFRDNLRVQTLRASLTPSSPTLSTWAASQDLGLPISDDERSLSASPGRSSTSSPNLGLPRFPSPGKVTASNIVRERGVPQFALSRPSIDEQNSRSATMPFGNGLREDLPSSPPLPVSKVHEYDPAWSLVMPVPVVEYDPASPQWNSDPANRSPPSLNTKAETSPGTMFPFEEINARNAALETLTSVNSSVLKAKISPPKIDFAAAPVLSPTHHVSPPTTMSLRNSSRRGLASPPSIPGISSDVSAVSSDISIPSPLHVRSPSLPITTTSNGSPGPQGPRAQPGKSVLTHALALRRMNSEIDNTRNSQKYYRMGREASPTLPWTAYRTPLEGGSPGFDLDLCSEASFGGTESDFGGCNRNCPEPFVFGSSPPTLPFQLDNRSAQDADVFVDPPESPTKRARFQADLPSFQFPSPKKDMSANEDLQASDNKILPRSTSNVAVVKRRKKSSPSQAARLGAPKGILKKGTLVVLTDTAAGAGNVESGDLTFLSPVEGTPARAPTRESFYDSDGFLRT